MFHFLNGTDHDLEVCTMKTEAVGMTVEANIDTNKKLSLRYYFISISF